MILEQGSQLVCTVVEDSTVMGYVVIDSTVGGRSCGGLRMLPDVDEAEIRSLGRAMTLKYGFLGLPQGGAKAGVRGDPEAPQAERWRRLVEFGRAIAPLLRSHVYIPGTDMGTEDPAADPMADPAADPGAEGGDPAADPGAEGGGEEAPPVE